MYYATMYYTRTRIVHSIICSYLVKLFIVCVPNGASFDLRDTQILNPAATILVSDFCLDIKLATVSYDYLSFLFL